MGFEPTGPCGHGISNAHFVSDYNKIDFDGFKQYLKSQRKRNAHQILSYAIKYGNVLQTGNASELLTFSDTKRHHIMEAIVTLSKYLGCYDTWKSIRDRYQLKWSTDDSLKTFTTLFNDDNNYSAMIAWLKDTCSKIPKSYANILIFNVLTGLRPDEACRSLNLIHTQASNYLNRQTMMLEHFRYPEIFIRRTKKAFISVVTDATIEYSKKSGDHTYSALRHAVINRGLQMHMAYCRKIFATYLRTNGIYQETIDLLQGRLPQTLFAKHYFRPDNKGFENIRNLLDSLGSTVR